MRRLRALLLFTLGYLLLSFLGPLVAAPLAVAAFYAGGLELMSGVEVRGAGERRAPARADVAGAGEPAAARLS